MSKKAKSEAADNSADTVMDGVLSENQAKLNKLNSSIQAAYERRRKIITDSKLYTYDKLSQLYGDAEGQALLDAVTAEHTLIGKLTDSGMSYADIEDGKIATVITKDLSRLGCDYLKTGELIEIVFPDYDVRYIAVNDNVDTAKSENELLAFKNIFNYWYARDCSKKIRAVFRAKGQSGKHLCPPGYGYKKSDTDKNLWVVDEPAAEVVRKIFKLCIDGYGPVQIARILTEQGIP